MSSFAPPPMRLRGGYRPDGLMHAPLNTRALLVVGQSLDGRRDRQGARRDGLAERISRRDPAYSCGSPRIFCRAGNFAQSLRHFDMMIRTNNNAAQLSHPNWPS